MKHPTVRSLPLAALAPGAGFTGLAGFAAFAGSLLALLLASGAAQPAAATEKLAQDSHVACTTCHDKPGSRLLTDQGKYFELMRSFDGFTEIQATMGACTTCHVRKPGSHKLTGKGKQFRETVQSMPGLRDFVMKSHPKAQAAPQPKGTGG
jgi:hypothetical protein